MAKGGGRFYIKVNMSNGPAFFYLKIVFIAVEIWERGYYGGRGYSMKSVGAPVVDHNTADIPYLRTILAPMK